MWQFSRIKKKTFSALIISPKNKEVNKQAAFIQFQFFVFFKLSRQFLWVCQRNSQLPKATGSLCFSAPFLFIF